MNRENLENLYGLINNWSCDYQISRKEIGDVDCKNNITVYIIQLEKPLEEFDGETQKAVYIAENGELIGQDLEVEGVKDFLEKYLSNKSLEGTVEIP